MMKEYKDGEQLLARHIPAAEAWKDGLNFFSQDEEYVQVGSWGYDTGTALKPHVHNHVPREVTVTQEVLIRALWGHKGTYLWSTRPTPC